MLTGLMSMRGAWVGGSGGGHRTGFSGRVPVSSEGAGRAFLAELTERAEKGVFCVQPGALCSFGGTGKKGRRCEADSFEE
jgi:hypothetical protein